VRRADLRNASTAHCSEPAVPGNGCFPRSVFDVARRLGGDTMPLMSDNARSSQHSAPRLARRSFEIRSDLAIEAHEFWSKASLTSVNWELAPIVRMTAPPAWQSRPLATWEIGTELFKSWILLFGFLPIDRHAFRLREVSPGLGFREGSSSSVNREWLHDREIHARESGCTVIDRVSVVSRAPGITSLLMPIYRLVFWHRHRRLRRKYIVLVATNP